MIIAPPPIQNVILKVAYELIKKKIQKRPDGKK